MPLFAPALPLIWAAGLGAWSLSHRMHLRAVKRVPIRILVGGTRGKTTTVKLITAALRLGGRTVCARTTGRQPEETLQGARLGGVIDWRPSPRMSEADIDEIRRWACAAAQRVAPDALVVENSAVAPEVMRAVGHHLMPPTLGVITDAVRDHADLWPADPDDIAKMHLSAMPTCAFVVHTSVCILDPHPSSTSKMHTEVCTANKTNEDPPLPQWMANHVSLATQVAVRCSSPLDEIGMCALTAVAHSLLPQITPLPNGAAFLDLFDANDPISAARAMTSLRRAGDQRLVALFAHRHDRAWRWNAFRPWLTEMFDEVIRFDRWPSAAAGAALHDALAGTLLVGLGNAVGPAQLMLAAIAGREG